MATQAAIKVCLSSTTSSLEEKRFGLPISYTLTDDVKTITLLQIQLSDEFTEYELPFGDNSYGNEVLSGFGWTAQMPKNKTQIEFYVDDLRWE